MSVRIVVDSTADLQPALKSRVEVVPMTVHFGDTEYVDGVTITHKEFYKKLAESKELPSTSQATPDAFARVLKRVTEAGDSAVVLTLSSKLSGTCQSAMIAAVEYKDVHIVDSGSAAIGIGVLAEWALQLADSGLSAKQIAEQLEQEKKNVCIIAMLDTLEYLKRGGRISKTAAFAGTLLNIKPVIGVTDGQIEMLGKARGTRQGYSMLVSEILKTGGADFDRPVLMGYTGLEDENLQKFMVECKAQWAQEAEDLPYTIVGSVIGTHAGPGAIAAAFFRKEE